MLRHIGKKLLRAEHCVNPEGCIPHSIEIIDRSPIHHNTCIGCGYPDDSVRTRLIARYESHGYGIIARQADRSIPCSLRMSYKHGTLSGRTEEADGGTQGDVEG